MARPKAALASPVDAVIPAPVVVYDAIGNGHLPRAVQGLGAKRRILEAAQILEANLRAVEHFPRENVPLVAERRLVIGKVYYA